MKFDEFLVNFEKDAGGKEQIALAIYYLETEEGKQSVSQSEIRSLIRSSQSTISPSGTSAYFKRLANAKWIAPTGDNEYRLTGSGREEVKARLDEGPIGGPRKQDDVFLDTDNFEGEERYEQLVKDINRCYQYRIYDATMVLSRKLFEDLVYQILQTHYAGENVQMFYDQENNRHYTFEELLNNLRDAVSTLRRYSRELDKALVEELRNLKNEGNAGAHAIRVDFTDEEIEAWSRDATRIAEVLFDVLQGARIADSD